MTPGVRQELGYKRAKCRYRILEVLDNKGYTATRIASDLRCSTENVSKVIRGIGHSERVLQKLREIGVPEQFLFDPHNREVV